MVLAVSLALVLAGSPPTLQNPQLLKRLKAEYTMDEDARKYFPRRTGTHTSVRLQGYERRLAMEAESETQAIAWRPVGPEVQSGRVIRILPNPKDSSELYVAFATGGVFKTRDWGSTWERTFEGQSSFGVGDMALAPDGKTVWIGSGEHNSQRTSYQGTGVFKSVDAGKSWQNMGLVDSNHVGAIAINPSNPSEVYVGALGHLYTANDERGVYKTTDGGKTWTQILKLGELVGVIDLEMDPRDPKTLYAAAWERERRAWDFRDGGKGTAIYKTTNGGATWTKLSGGLPSGDLGRIGLAIARSKPNVVYAFIDNWNSDPDTIYDDEYAPSGVLTPWRFVHLNEQQFGELDKTVVERFVARYLPQGTKADELISGIKAKTTTLEDVAAMMERRNLNVFAMERVTHEIYRSEDAGKSWKRTHGYRFGVHGGYYFGEIRINPKDENDVWTLGTILLRSKDGGRTWSRSAQGVHVDFHDLWIDSSNTNLIVLGCDGGPYISENDGRTWRVWNNLPVGQTTTLAVDMKVPYNIYVGLQDNGTLVGPSTYTPGRSPLTAWKSIGGGDGSWIAVDPRDDGDLVYIASQFGSHSALNQKTNERWTTVARARQGEPALRYNWISPLIISPHHPDILYLGSQHVHRSFNKGRAWEKISPDISKNRPAGDVPHSTVKVLDESPLRFGLIFAGTDDGKVMMTPNGGHSWHDVSTPENDKWVSRVVCSRFDVNTVYVTQTGYRDDDYRAYVWKSSDLGKTWVSIAGNLPAEFVNSIREDLTDPKTLYVATGMGVFWTRDGGANWSTLGEIPRCAVHDIVIHPRDQELVAATHGKSVWVFNLRNLGMLTDEIRKKDVHVFEVPTIAYSENWTMRRSQNWDASPPNEPTVGGWLWAQRPGPATVRIKDKSGKTVKEKSFAAKRGLQQWSVELVLSPATDKWAVDSKNRPRKTVEEILADPFAATRGKYIGPGEYAVEIEVAGKSHSVPWRMSGG